METLGSEDTENLIRDLSDEKAKLHQTVNALESQVATFKQHITHVESENARLKVANDALKTDNAALNETVTNRKLCV